MSEIWDSREQLEAFGETMTPILEDVGAEFARPLGIFEVHNLITR